MDVKDLYSENYRQMKNKDHMIISIDTEKTFDKVQHPFFDKSTQQSGNRGSIPKHNEGHT